MLARGMNVLPIATPSLRQAMAKPVSSATASRRRAMATSVVASMSFALRPFVELPQGIDRRGRHLLERRIRMHALERLPDLLAQMPRETIQRRQQLVRPVRFFMKGCELTARWAQQPQCEQIAGTKCR